MQGTYSRLNRANDTFNRYAQNIRTSRTIRDARSQALSLRAQGRTQEMETLLKNSANIRFSRSQYMGLNNG
nr:MAG TPA: hypothetical protein [Caudoviricetes sp.]